MAKKFELTIPYNKIQAMSGELLIETLAFQSVIVEMLLPNNNVRDEIIVNERLDYHRSRIWDNIYAEYGETPKADIDTEQKL